MYYKDTPDNTLSRNNTSLLYESYETFEHGLWTNSRAGIGQLLWLGLILKFDLPLPLASCLFISVTVCLQAPSTSTPYTISSLRGGTNIKDLMNSGNPTYLLFQVLVLFVLSTGLSKNW